jgi:hypothetical protein
MDANKLIDLVVSGTDLSSALDEFARGVLGEYAARIVTTKEFRDELDKRILAFIKEQYDYYRGLQASYKAVGSVCPSNREPVITPGYILGSGENEILYGLPKVSMKKDAFVSSVTSHAYNAVDEKWLFSDLRRKDQLKLINQSLLRLKKQGKIRTSTAIGYKNQQVHAYEPAD